MPEAEHPVTPTPPGTPSTPQTVRTLRAQGQQLLQYPYLAPTFRKSLDRFIKGSLVQAQTGAEALDHLQLYNYPKLLPMHVRLDSNRIAWLSKNDVLYT